MKCALKTPFLARFAGCWPVCIRFARKLTILVIVIFWMISDLTEIRKTQEVLKDALVNAQNANNAKSTFLSRMSHEIRTPMNAIIGMTAIATTALNDRSKIENCLSKIAFSSRHLMMLINDVLDMSKIESGKLTLTYEPFELSDLISNIGSIIYPQAAFKKQEFEINVNVSHECLTGVY